VLPPANSATRATSNSASANNEAREFNTGSDTAPLGPRARDAPAAPLRGGTDGPDASGAPGRAAAPSRYPFGRNDFVLESMAMAICSPPVGNQTSRELQNAR